MSISIDTSSLKEIRPHEYAVRFIFGGLVTLITGLIAQHFGPSIAGLFLAFPAIFPPPPRSSRSTKNSASSR